jgi:hypothetical protein
MSRGLRLLFAIFLLALLAAPARTAVAATDVVDAEIDALPSPEARTEPEPGPDWKGVRRDTQYFLGYQFAVIGILYVMPTSTTNWDRSDDHLGKWWDNVTHPHLDDDAFYINYLLHPYWGATYYIRGRERGLDRWQSAGYSAFLSALYEFGAEALFERPSYQDLVITPVLGSLLGEFVFAPIRSGIKAKSGPLGSWDKLALVLTDPLGAANDLTNRLFGVETQVALTPFRGMSRPTTGPLASSLYGAGNAARPGLDPQRPRKPIWGLQLDVRW